MTNPMSTHQAAVELARDQAREAARARFQRAKERFTNWSSVVTARPGCCALTLECLERSRVEFEEARAQLRALEGERE